jgi:hypothetical protein
MIVVIVADEDDVRGGKVVQWDRRGPNALRTETAEWPGVHREHRIRHDNARGGSKEKRRVPDERRRGAAGSDDGRRRRLRRQRNVLRPRNRLTRPLPLDQVAERSVRTRVRIEEPGAIEMI